MVKKRRIAEEYYEGWGKKTTVETGKNFGDENLEQDFEADFVDKVTEDWGDMDADHTNIYFNWQNSC